MSDLANLRIVHWNVCGVRRKTRHLRALLLAKHIDIALISETKLRDRVGLRLKGYCVYRQDKLSANTACHGLLVAVKRTIPHNLLPRLNLASMDALGIQLDNFDGAPLSVYAVYKPPKTRLATSDIDALLLLSDCPTIAAGDMNSKHPAWNSVNVNTSGRILYQHSDLRQFAVRGPSDFTYYPRRTDHRKNVLDIIMYHGLTCRRPVQAVYEERFGSDHCPVIREARTCGHSEQLRIIHLPRYLEANPSRRQLIKLYITRNYVRHSMIHYDVVQSLNTPDDLFTQRMQTSQE